MAQWTKTDTLEAIHLPGDPAMSQLRRRSDRWGRRKGAAIGAGVGAAGGAVRRRGQERQAAEQQQSASAQQEAGRQAYQRSRAACLEGRGYTVK